MGEPRDIRVTLTRSECVALMGCVTGELESLTEADWESGHYDDLDYARSAMQRAWSRSMRRAQRRAHA